MLAGDWAGLRNGGLGRQRQIIDPLMRPLFVVMEFVFVKGGISPLRSEPEVFRCFLRQLLANLPSVTVGGPLEKWQRLSFNKG
jgi:hypothetical protein